MGQYYMPLIKSEDKTTILYPFDYDNGLKLTEHSWIGNYFVNAALSFIKDRPSMVAWIGDYSNDCVEAFEKKAGGREQFMEFFDQVWRSDRHESTDKPLIEEYRSLLTMGTKGTYLVNHTRRQYIDIAQFIQANKFREEYDIDDWCLNPLPLLTACGNGQGGGDYYGINEDVIGTWAFSIIEYTETKPANYKKVRYRFKED